jgi:hypothetical protein
MKSLLTAFVLCVAYANAAYAQADAFHGIWKVNLSKSTGTGLPKQEYVILNVANEVEHCTNDIIGADGVRRKSEYKAKYNDGKWYPTKNLDTGKDSGGKVMMVRLDPRSELRLGQRADGRAGGIISRVVLEDGKTMQITVMGLDGKVSQTLFLEKQESGPTP